LDVAGDTITVPVVAAAVRAPLIEAPDVSVHLVGMTGQGKTAYAVTVQRAFAPHIQGERLPATWFATANFLEDLAFRASDVLLLIDDYVPGVGRDGQRIAETAERVFRACGNRTGRGRMAADLSLRPARPPRALVLSTGEDLPQTQSTAARVVMVAVRRGDIDFCALAPLQAAARTGIFAGMMASYVAWIARLYDLIRAELRKEHAAIRQEASAGKVAHARIPHNQAALGLGMAYFSRFAADVGALSAPDADHLWNRSWAALQENAERRLSISGAPILSIDSARSSSPR
jgi:hypothetical protein